MSTKFSLKYGDGFHLYDDWMDECQGLDVVNLRLDNVAFTASNTSVDVAIPRPIAVQLGLIPLAQSLTSGNGGQFSERYSRREMREQVDSMGPGLFSTEGLLCQADDGECV